VAPTDESSLVPLGGLLIEQGPDSGVVIAVGERPVTIGRESGCEVRLTDTSCSRRHVRVLSGGDGRVLLEDLGSANGTYVNGARVSQVLLSPGDGIGIGETLLRFLSEAELIAALRQRTMRVTERDPVTQACSRRLFDMRLRTEVTLAARSGGTLNVGLLGLDGLADLRAGAGAAGADRVLQAAGLTLTGYLRENDLLARFDDDTFGVLIVDPSPNTAYLVAERMCAGIEGLAVEAGRGQPFQPTASIGLASEKGRRDLTPDGLLERARDEFDRAREAGGNCVSRWVHSAVREPVPAVSGDLRGTVVGAQKKL
jgi:two-component system, cell cycle response regulator